MFQVRETGALRKETLSCFSLLALPNSLTIVKVIAATLLLDTSHPIITHLVVLNNRNLFSHRSKGQQSEIKMSAGLHSLQKLGDYCFLFLPSPGDSRRFLGLWQHPSNLHFLGDITSSTSLYLLCVPGWNLSLCLYFIRTLVMIFRAHWVTQGNP